MQSVGRVTSSLLDVLDVLLTGDQELYGLKISQLSGLKTGTVYPILARLESIGWVDSEWETGEREDRGPRRRFYRLNPDGMAAARVLRAERRPSSTSRARPRPRTVRGTVSRLGFGT